jgi:8-hydroxy-5-deazaflavin:NADPH oxidoreductase
VSESAAGATTAIVGVGNIGSALVRDLVRGDQAVLLALKNESRAKALADQLGPLARATSVKDALATADAVVLVDYVRLYRSIGLLPDEVNDGS